MNYSELFLSSWRLTWRSRPLWLLGAIASLGPIGATLVRLYVTTLLAAQLPHLNAWQAQPDRLLPWSEDLMAGAGTWLIGGLVVFFFVSLGLWLLMTVAEGGLIESVFQLEKGRQIGIRQALGAGRRLLTRFIGIDTVLFFPLFLLVFLIMLLLIGVLVGTTALALSEATFETVGRLLVLGGICLIPLLCLLLPGTLLTMLFRTLAFRDSTIRRVGVRESIRHAARIFRQQVGLMLLLFAILWGMGYLVDLFLGLLAVPLFGLVTLPGILTVGTTTSLAWTGPTTWIAAVLFVIISVFARAFLHAYTATVWTVAYGRLLARPGAQDVSRPRVETRPV